MIRNYLKIAARHLVKNKLISAINIMGLAIGMACCTLLFLFVKDELTHDRFHERSGRIYRVLTAFNDPTDLGASTSAPIGPAMKADLPEVEEYVRLVGSTSLYRVGDHSFSERAIFVDPSFFDVFSFRVVEGEMTDPLGGINDVVLSETMARKYFGPESPVGKMIAVEKSGEFQSLRVTAVAADPPKNSTVQFGILRPFAVVQGTDDPGHWFDLYLNTFVLLGSDTEAIQLTPKLPDLVDKHAGEVIKETQERYGNEIAFFLGLQPLHNIHLEPKIGAFNGLKEASNPVYSYILATIGFFILLVGCINFTNLSLARSLPRSKEIGIRKVIGANKKQLRWQFLGESFILCFLAIVAGLILTELLLPFFNDVTGKQLSLNLVREPEILLFIGGLLLATSFVAGIYPSVALARVQVIAVLKGKQRLSGKNHFGRAMIILQFAIAVLLIVGALGVSNQVNYLLNRPLGYNDENLLRLHVPRNEGERILAVLKNDMAANPSIAGIGGRSGGFNSTSFRVGSDRYETYHTRVGNGYLDAMGIELVAGRNFDSSFATDTVSSIIINETFAKRLGWDDPVGKKIIFEWSDDQEMTVIGVVRDYHFASLKEELSPILWHQLPRMTIGEINIKISRGSVREAVAAVESQWSELLPYRPFDYQFVSEINATQYTSESNWERIISSSSTLAIIIALTGLFGLASLAIKERTKEIGIRKVLGASAGSLAWLLTSQFARLVVAGVLLAAPVGYLALSRWLETFPYRTSIDGVIFLAAGLIALAGSTAIISYQSLKVARANPTDALRYE